MSVENPTVSDQPSAASGEPSTKDSVAYETYRKAVGEVKTLKARMAEFEAKESEREQQLLAEQGKYKEALDNTVKKTRDLEAALEAKDKAFAKRVFTKEVEAVALQFGARKEALEDIVKVGDWSTVEIDENFSINQEQLKAQIAALSKNKPFYFVSNAAAPRDVSTSQGTAPSSKSVDALTKDEIIAQLKSIK
ncbi:MAG: hypothetical protein IPQ08_05910 [Chitinophagaceae bacterium]|nr:hypothetical protein [Chitinophagaceae bacterium]